MHNPRRQEKYQYLGKYVCLSLLAISTLNYLLHMGGFSFFDESSIPQLGYPYTRDIPQMKKSEMYAGHADAFAEFMTVIVLQFVLSGIVIIIQTSQILYNGLKGARFRSSVENPVMAALVLFFVLGSYPWALGQDSTFWNQNPKLGGQPYWFVTLLIAVVWCGISCYAVLTLTDPRSLNGSMRRSRGSKGKK